jgi:hypothetical protein
MAQTLTRDVVVDELSKFGFKSEGKYINWSKSISESEKGKVVPGGVYRCELYVADSGKEYVNKVIVQNGQNTMSSMVKAMAGTAPVGTGTPMVATKAAAPIVKPVPAGIDIARAKRFTPKAEVSTGLSKDEWAAKDVRISRQGLIQASLIALAPVVALDVLFVEAEKLATQALEFVNRV